MRESRDIIRGDHGGSYGTMPVVSCVGPEGGQELVEASLAALRKLFPTPKNNEPGR